MCIHVIALYACDRNKFYNYNVVKVYIYMLSIVYLKIYIFVKHWKFEVILMLDNCMALPQDETELDSRSWLETEKGGRT